MVPNQLLQKFPAKGFTATTRLEFTPRAEGDTTGLVVMGQDYAALMVTRGANGLDVKRVTCRDAPQGNAETVDATASGLKNPIWLRVSVETEAMCTFSYSTDGEKFTISGPPFPARGGHRIGARVGLVCIGTGGHADFDWFRIE